MDNRRTVSAVLAAVVASALFAAACEDPSLLTPVGPTNIGAVAGTTFTLAVQPAPLFRRSIFGAVCPFRQPFFVPFDLLVGTRLGLPLFLNQVRVHFVDSFGIVGPQITIPQLDLLNRFGTTQIPLQGSRTFPFSFEFGCATQPFRNLFVWVETIDTTRATQSSTVTVAVR